MRKVVVTLALLPVLASCGVAHALAGEKRYQQISPAMEPTIKRNSTVTAKVVKAGDYRPADGDIVVFKPPASWGPDGADLARMYRVVGIPGETVQCCGPKGQVKRNGKWADEPYIAPDGMADNGDPMKVPDGQLYVLADHRGYGADSSEHGTVPVDSVIGIVETD